MSERWIENITIIDLDERITVDDDADIVLRTVWLVPDAIASLRGAAGRESALSALIESLRRRE